MEIVRLARGLCRLTTVVGLSVVIAGCATMMPRDVLPERLVDEADLAGLPGVRIWGDASASEIDRLVKAEAAKPRPVASTQALLAISGGAGDGAYGAGLLVGWSAAGTRPRFNLVTGISAGGLIAPFVFAGPQRDGQLKEVFTKYGTADILLDNGLPGLLGGSSVADSAPLANLIAKYVDRQLLREIAAEYRKGNLLLIGTANLEAQRPVLWDMGRIAVSGHPRALELFRKILLASASIPGVFPPVRIQVRAGGRTYEEVHVDGGITQQVFLAPSAFAFSGLDRALGTQVSRRLYVILNGKVSPIWEPVEERTLSIAQRSISTLTKYQSIGDLYRIYTRAKRDNIDFNLAAIPASFNVKSASPFDPAYLVPLFQLGYRQGRQG